MCQSPHQFSLQPIHSVSCKKDMGNFKSHPCLETTRQCLVSYRIWCNFMRCCEGHSGVPSDGNMSKESKISGFWHLSFLNGGLTHLKIGWFQIQVDTTCHIDPLTPHYLHEVHSLDTSEMYSILSYSKGYGSWLEEFEVIIPDKHKMQYRNSSRVALEVD